jgi:hypothetical protein
VVEGGRRGHILIHFALGIDEGGISLDASGTEKCGKERVFVFAVAILIGEDFGGEVGLVMADTKSDANIAELQTDVVVNGAELGVIVRQTFG